MHEPCGGARLASLLGRFEAGLRTNDSSAGTLGQEIFPMIERATHICAPALLLVVLALLTAAPAQAGPNAVVRDCADDGFVEVDRYSRKELRQGRNRIPADLDAYSDCTAQINAALDKPRAGIASNDGGFPGGDGTASGGFGGSAGVGGTSGSDGAPLTAAEQREADTVERKRQLARADTESLLGDRNVDPATAAGALDRSDTTNGVSLPLLLAIIALALGLAAGAALALRRGSPALFAGTVGRIPRPRSFGSLPPLRRRR